LDQPTDKAYPVRLLTDHDGQVAEATDDKYTRWHRRFGHVGPQLVRKIHTVVDDIEQAVEPAEDQPICEVCALAKKVRVVNRVSPERSI
jgi:hypothetical protein